MVWMMVEVVGLLFGLLCALAIYADRRALKDTFGPRSVGECATAAAIPVLIGATIFSWVVLWMAQDYSTYVPGPVVVSHKLVSLRIADSISGTFFLGSGNIGDQKYLSYFMVNADGSASPGQIEQNGNVRIYQENRSAGELMIRDWKSKWGWLSVPWLTEQHAEFHIPTGSMTTTFRLGD